MRTVVFFKDAKNLISLYHNIFAPYGTSIFKTSSVDVYYLSKKTPTDPQLILLDGLL